MIQRVSQASVSIQGKVHAAIREGMVVLLGIGEDDTFEDVDWLCRKLLSLRIFSDREDKMNLAVTEVGGEIMVISQFTLHANYKKGNRPSFIHAAKPEVAIPLYTRFLEHLSHLYPEHVVHGEFGAMMEVALINNGPVTITMDTKNKE